MTSKKKKKETYIHRRDCKNDHFWKTPKVSHSYKQLQNVTVYIGPQRFTFCVNQYSRVE